MKFPRRPPRLRVFQGYASPVYFVTFCTYDRKPWLATAEVHQAFVRFAETAANRFNIAVGRYIIMPDHIHLFVCGGPDFVLGQWIGLLKQSLAKAAGKSAAGGTPWQESFFDHLLRGDESMSEKWDYIRQNPVRAGLMQLSEDWPYQGEIVPIDRA
jgi:REP element-mobilizing transposase RayT